jgi:hypothetical protein
MLIHKVTHHCGEKIQRAARDFAEVFPSRGAGGTPRLSGT